MKNLNGYLKKILLLFSLSFLLLSFFPKLTYAETLFTITTDITHTIADNTIDTEIIATISTDTTRVLSYYTATISQENLSVECYNANTNTKLNCSTYKRTQATDIIIDFNNAVITAKSPYKLKLVYQTTTKVADTYNIVSAIQDTTTSSITVIYSNSKGQPLWASDTIQSIKSIGSNYQITIEKPIYSTLTLLFGNQISYKFTISKTFSNSESDSNETFEIITPPDTSSQTIVWDNINPLPNVAEQDDDGNYIFKYILSAGQTLDCSIQGHILMHNSATADTPSAYLTTTSGYWDSTSKAEFTRINTYLVTKGLTLPEGFSDITSVNTNVQELVYKYLYQYVVERLNPEKELAPGIITDSRIGFDNLVSNPNSLTPADYSDFLVTILRKYNIPARQVIGFVSNVSGYTSDGFYNYWVEAYDYTQGKWITLDPFLEDYSSKSLYNSPFFDHIVILHRGKSPVSPKLTFYNDSDFKVVSSSQDKITATFAPNAQLVFENTDITSKYIKMLVNISNTGNIAISKYSISQSSIENLQKYIDPINNINSQIILPKENGTIQFNIQNNGVLSNIFVNIKFINNGYSKELLLESNPTLSIPLYLQIFTKVISILAFAGLVYLIYFLVNKAIIKHKHNG